MRRNHIAVLFAVSLVTSGAAATLVTTTWNNAGAANWHVGANWDTGNVPTAADQVRIVNGGSPSIEAAATADSIEVGGGSELSVRSGGVLTSGGGLLHAGTDGQSYISVDGAGSRIN